MQRVSLQGLVFFFGGGLGFKVFVGIRVLRSIRETCFVGIWGLGF